MHKPLKKGIVDTDTKPDSQPTSSAPLKTQESCNDETLDPVSFAQPHDSGAGCDSQPISSPTLDPSRWYTPFAWSK